MRSFRLNIILLLSIVSLSVSAVRPFNPNSNVTHWIGLSVLGEEANPILKSNMNIDVLDGWGGQATLFYELHKNNFFFNVGLGVDYVTTSTKIETFTDEPYDNTTWGKIQFSIPSLVTVDEAINVSYRYVYSNYNEQQRQMRLVLPIQFGFEFAEWWYTAFGVTFRFTPLQNSFAVSSRMFTEGQAFFAEEILEKNPILKEIGPVVTAEVFRNNIEGFEPGIGFWPEDEFNNERKNNKIRSATNEMSVEAEIGVNLNLMRRFRMRAGVFVGYDLPLSSIKPTHLIDYPVNLYSNTDLLSQDLRNPNDYIDFNSMLDASQIAAQRIRVGLKLTLLLNVTPKSTLCNCYDN